MAIPPGLRRQMAAQGNIDPLLGVLTPGQRVSLFPNYFKDSLSGLAGQRSEFGGIPASKFPSGITPNSPRLNQTASVDESTLPPMVAAKVKNVTMSGTREKPTTNSEYYDRMYGALYKAAVEKGVPNPEVIARLGAAQTSIETGYGKHMVGNNAFGIKGEGVTAETEEVINGQRVKIKAGFRAYGSVEESAGGYIDFLQKNKRYAALFAAQSVDEAIAIQGTTGYATDPSYGSKLASIHGNMGVNAPNATAIVDEVETASPIAQQGSVEDDTKGIGDNPSAIPLAVAAQGGITVDETPLRPIDDPLSYMQGRNPRAADLNEVDPVLLKSYSEGIQQFERENPGYKVEVFGKSSGVRTSGSTNNHGIQSKTGKGGAMDFVIVDKETGQQLTNFNRPYEGQIGSPGEVAPLYAKLHASAALAQEYYYPDSTKITFGGGFQSGDTALDLMHGDVTHEGQISGYNLETGWSPEMMKRFNIPENVALGSAQYRQKLAQEVYGSVDDRGNYTNRTVVAKDEQKNLTVFASKDLSNDAVTSTEVAQGPASSNVATTSMAYGGIISEPHTAINNRTGEKTNIGEKGTGGEYVVPRNKVDASELGQQSYQMPQSAPQPSPREPTEAMIEKAQPAQRINATGQQAPSIGGVTANHPVAPPSARKAYADAGLESRFNNFSPLGTQYRSFGA